MHAAHVAPESHGLGRREPGSQSPGLSHDPTVGPGGVSPFEPQFPLGEWRLDQPHPSQALLTKDRRLIWGQRGPEAPEPRHAWASPPHCAPTHPQPFSEIPCPGAQASRVVRRGEFCGSCPKDLPRPLPRGLAFKGSPGPLLSSPKSLSATPTPPPGPSPCFHFLIWVYHTGRKRRNFSLQACLGEGVSPGPWGSQAPLSGTPAASGHAPSPSPSSHAYPPHPAGKEPGVFQASGLTGKERRGSSDRPGGGPGEGGAQGAEEGACEKESGAQARAGSRRWGPGHLGSTKGRAGRMRGGQDLWGFKVPMLNSGEQSSPGLEEFRGQSFK